MANDFQEFKGQMLGTTDAGETKKVSVDNNGKLKVVIDNSSESGSGGESGIGVNIVDQEGNSVNEDNPFPVKLSGNNTVGIDQTTDGDTNRVVAKISQEAGENVVKATDLETLITTLNGKIDTLDAVIDTIKDTIIDKVTVETTGVSDILTLLTFLDAPGYSEEIDVSKYGMVRVHITKNNYFDGTLVFQGLVSGSAYKNIPVRNVNTGILVETIPSPNPPLVVSEDYIVDVRGLNKIRIQATYTTAGDVSVTGRGEPWSEIQYVNIANQEPINTQLSGSTLAEQKTEADAVANVITFSQNINVIEIFHAEETWQNFIVNGLTLVIPAGGYRTPIAGVPGRTVTIPAAVNCIVGRLI